MYISVASLFDDIRREKIFTVKKTASKSESIKAYFDFYMNRTGRSQAGTVRSSANFTEGMLRSYGSEQARLYSNSDLFDGLTPAFLVLAYPGHSVTTKAVNREIEHYVRSEYPTLPIYRAWSRWSGSLQIEGPGLICADSEARIKSLQNDLKRFRAQWKIDAWRKEIEREIENTVNLLNLLFPPSTVDFMEGRREGAWTYDPENNQFNFTEVSK